MLAEDVSFDDVGLGCERDVCCASREDGVAVVGLAVFGLETDEALRVF